ncbi:MAG: valine--tRNA ligase [Saccharofermentanales bacterium]
MSRIDTIPKAFEPGEAEARIYKKWLDKGYFHAVPDPDKKPYTIVIPPPNITGQLHMGHALDNTLQDILIRWRRMQGYSALWMPGTDHASIATEAKIVEAMTREGLTKDGIGREEFLKKAWLWKAEYGGRIVEQLKRLGSSCDWERERFTMDEGLSEAVTEVFIKLYRKGLIYRGERIINWCPTCLTSISDAEVEFEETEGSFWHIMYPFKDGNGGLVVATTRPETMLGDTAVAVHPDDPRFAAYIGKTVILPLTGREIPVIADTYVDKELGTGAVKITPAHDPNDFEVGLRHNLSVLNVMTGDAHMNDNAGRFKGMDRYAARKLIVEELKILGLLVKTEPHKHNVGHCYRCSTTVEPMVSFQWFVSMKSLAEPAIEAVRDGRTQFIPDRFDKIYYNWMENIRDWCISRQLWWGHRIPAYYCSGCGEIVVSKEMPDRCPVCGGTTFKQDPDTLDTWFSSALWPFSTLGWPEHTSELQYFYPTSVLVTGYDIIFFWVARMIFSALEQTGEVPFKHVYIHGLVRDEKGLKMSKSLGNGIDPLEIIDRSGADALRYSLITGNSPGNDQRFLTMKVEAGRNFANKIWNAFRFVMMNMEDVSDFAGMDPDDFAPEDKWILTRLNSLINEVTGNLEDFELGVALAKLYSFIWEEFCDWYIEMVKPRLFDKAAKGRTEALFVLNHVLSKTMKLLHPYMPFLTEEIYGYLIGSGESIMTGSWPVFRAEFDFPDEVGRMELLMDAIRKIRNIRVNMNVPPSRKAAIIVVTQDERISRIFSSAEAFMDRLASVSAVQVRTDREGIANSAVTAVIDGGEIFIPLGDLIDISKEIIRLEEESVRLAGEIGRVDLKLSNEEFLSRAPEKVVNNEKEKRARFVEMKMMVEDRITALHKV